ncbi:hypothetical protein [Fibrella forsythiae]|uniref:Uncharacterized protein n=1 Tax=Fibrella forsythiae TaxID=2817061 RepID=A0ABS3JI05_9BACT|nr:hypothetical protein [Fibrella forsythiae]MBO0949033.1 hypothetical protein [Fibrella forsythiae]
MVKINVDVPDDVHYVIRRIQIDLEMQGEKKHLKELYAEVIKEGANRLRAQLKSQYGQENASQ